MPKAKCCVADIVFQLWMFQVGNDLSLDKRTKGAAVAYLATKLYTRGYGLSIVRITKIIRFNLNGVRGIGTGKPDTATTLWLHDNTEQGPTSSREAKPCCVPSASSTAGRIWKSGLSKPVLLFQNMTASGAGREGSESEESHRQQTPGWS